MPPSQHSWSRQIGPAPSTRASGTSTPSQIARSTCGCWRLALAARAAIGRAGCATECSLLCSSVPGQWRQTPFDRAGAYPGIPGGRVRGRRRHFDPRASQGPQATHAARQYADRRHDTQHADPSRIQPFLLELTHFWRVMTNGALSLGGLWDTEGRRRDGRTTNGRCTSTTAG